VTATCGPARTTRSRDHDDAEQLAGDAGGMLAAIRHVAAGAALGRLGDRCSHELLAAEIWDRVEEEGSEHLRGVEPDTPPPGGLG